MGLARSWPLAFEGGDDDVGGSEGGEHDVVQVPGKDGLFLMVTRMMTLRTVPRMLRLKSVAAKTPPAVMWSILRYSVRYIFKSLTKY